MCPRKPEKRKVKDFVSDGQARRLETFFTSVFKMNDIWETVPKLNSQQN